MANRKQATKRKNNKQIKVISNNTSKIDVPIIVDEEIKEEKKNVKIRDEVIITTKETKKYLNQIHCMLVI